ncbi:nuclear transport factor 2 family protein [Antarcticirhabdus aurantiaca]|uniref:Nuclear transport factor 2 family protein n=1 Tax=Antarcticirhabdus aurantiaca TaxID=2606717 RepID=A0ACD4NUN5_9HYPH|nr:nuclear transport factor 2 family protein [Antarcticirhabdus aurantiaca]WAJ30546.1 nuclear transport factor 2 family protein [Jeongeuplla avenae]
MMFETVSDADRMREVVSEVMDAVMSGKGTAIAAHLAPGALFTNRSNAGAFDAPWFDRLEGEYRLAGPEEVKSFMAELMQKATYLSYEQRGILVEDGEAASRCDWTRLYEKDGTVVTGTTMYWFAFTSDFRIRSIESIGSIHSVIPSRRGAETSA